VIPLRPTLVAETQTETPQARRLKALTEEEGRLRALARKGTRVRVTFEAEVVDAMLATSVSGQRLLLTVKMPDGEHHPIDPEQAGVHIEALQQWAERQEGELAPHNPELTPAPSDPGSST
jgi:hypothetical protein